MGYNQDRKHEHWLKISPKNIEEKNTNHAEASPAPKRELDIERSPTGTKVWETGDEGFTYGTHLSGEEGRKPHSGEVAGKTKNPNNHGRGREGQAAGSKGARK